MIPNIPLSGSFVDEAGSLTRISTELLNLIRLISNSVTEYGTTAQRPTTNLWIGRPFYDTTLNKPVWVNAVTPSVVWKDATGLTV